jgi:hypothetical protein
LQNLKHGLTQAWRGIPALSEREQPPTHISPSETLSITSSADQTRMQYPAEDGFAMEQFRVLLKNEPSHRTRLSRKCAQRLQNPPRPVYRGVIRLKRGLMEFEKISL